MSTGGACCGVPAVWVSAVPGPGDPEVEVLSVFVHADINNRRATEILRIKIVGRIAVSLLFTIPAA